MLNFESEAKWHYQKKGKHSEPVSIPSFPYNYHLKFFSYNISSIMLFLKIVEYFTYCFMFRPLMKLWKLHFSSHHFPKQDDWLMGEENNSSSSISQERRELLRQNKNKSSYFWMTFIDQIKFMLWNSGHNIQLRIYFFAVLGVVFYKPRSFRLTF